MPRATATPISNNAPSNGQRCAEIQLTAPALCTGGLALLVSAADMQSLQPRLGLKVEQQDRSAFANDFAPVAIMVMLLLTL